MDEFLRLWCDAELFSCFPKLRTGTAANKHGEKDYTGCECWPFIIISGGKPGRS